MKFEALIEEVWSDDSEDERTQDRRMQPANRSRSSGNTALVDHMAATDAMPNIVNVRDSRHVRFGPTIISVTNNESTETVKARFLCLDLETVKQAKRLRCSLAVCACWATLVSVALTLYVYLLVVSHKTRIDIGLNRTWYLRRDNWLALDVAIQEVLTLPVPYAVIAHTEHAYCDDVQSCKSLVLEMQKREIDGRYGDIVPNFLVGGNGWIFEGRGANVVGFLLQAMKHSLITISFIGDYGRDTPDELQFKHVNELLETLVQGRILKEHYLLVGYCQLVSHVASPGRRVVAELKRFSHWDPRNVTQCDPGRVNA